MPLVPGAAAFGAPYVPGIMAQQTRPNMQLSLAGFVRHLEQIRAPRTAQAYGEVAAAFLAYLGKKRVPDRHDVETFLACSGKNGVAYAPTTRNHQLGALRGLSKYAVAERCWPHDPTAGVPFVREPPRDPAVLSVNEVAAFFSALKTVSRAEDLTRDRAMLALLFTLGLRVHELVGLDLDQVDVASATLVSVRGKGRTVHDLPVEASTLALVLAWIAERPLRATEGEPALFVSRLGTRLSKRSVQLLFQKLRLATGTRKKVTPHTARHSAATLALLGGADLASISELLRHGDVNTTRLYLRLSGERKRQVVQVLSTVIPAELRVAINDGAVLALVHHAPVQQPMAPAMMPLSLVNPAEIGPGLPSNDNAKKSFDVHGRLGAHALGRPVRAFGTCLLGPASASPSAAAETFGTSGVEPLFIPSRLAGPARPAHQASASSANLRRAAREGANDK